MAETTNRLLHLNRGTRLVVLSVLLGVIGALGAQLFLWLLHLSEQALLGTLADHYFLTVEAAHAAGRLPPETHYAWLIPVATTVGGLLSGLLVYGFAPEAEGHGTDAAVRAFHQTGGWIRYRVPLVKTLASAITIGSGGTAGREGPTAQIAAGIGSIIGSLLKLSTDERRYMVLIGMAAGLSAIFKSPLGTAIFAVEVLYSMMAFEGEALIYTLIAASVSYAVTGLFDGFAPLFILPAGIGINGPRELLWFALLGLICGGTSALLPSIFYKLRDGFRAIRIPNHFKPAIGGLILGLMGVFLPGVLGGGYGYIQLGLQGAAGLSVGLLLLLAFGKIVAMALTIGSGGSGGVFAPTLFVGVMLGAALAALLHDLGIPVNEAALAVVGMAAMFAGAARVPIAALVMVTEMTGGYHLVAPAMLAVSISFIVQYALTRRATYPSLYEAQVDTQAESPAHHGSMKTLALSLLHKQGIHFDQSLCFDDLPTLAATKGIPISDSRERLYRLDIPTGSILAGQTIGEVLPTRHSVHVVAIVRGEDEVPPKPDTVLEVGDVLLVKAEEHAIQAFRSAVEAFSQPVSDPQG
jgi:CIC family chloride channel protein